MGWGMGDIIGVFKLAVKVYTAYKDAPKEYQHISEEVMSLQVNIDKIAQYFERNTLSDDNWLLCQKELECCQSILKDLDSFIEKHPGLASVNTYQGGIAILKERLISNQVLLTDFIERFEILTTTLEYIKLIPLPQL